MCINTGNKSLSGRFFVPCGTINLSSKKQTRNTFYFKCMFELVWKYKIIFNCVTGAHNNCVFKTRYGLNILLLYFKRQ